MKLDRRRNLNTFPSHQHQMTQGQACNLFRAKMPLLIVLGLRVVALSVLEPFDELSSGFADFLASSLVDKLGAGLGAPCLGDVLRDQVCLVVLQQYGGNLRDELGFLGAHEAFGASEEGLLVAVGSDHLLEHRSASGNLLDDAFVKQSLCKNCDSLMLRLDPEFLCLEVDGNVIDFGNAALFLGLLEDPAAKGIVRTAFAVRFVVVIDCELVLQIGSKLIRASPDCLLGCINGPLDLVWRRIADFLSIVLDLTCEFVIASSIQFYVAPVVGVAIVWTSLLRSVLIAVLAGMLACLAVCLFGRFVLSALLRSVFEDEATQLEARIDCGVRATSFAIENDLALSQLLLGLGVRALPAEDEFADIDIEQILQLGSGVRAIDNVAVVGGDVFCLGLDAISMLLERKVGITTHTKLHSKELDNLRWWSCQRLCDGRNVRDDGLDSITLAFDFALNTTGEDSCQRFCGALAETPCLQWHFVSVEGILVASDNIDERHVDGWLFLKTI